MLKKYSVMSLTLFASCGLDAVLGLVLVESGELV